MILLLFIYSNNTLSAVDILLSNTHFSPDLHSKRLRSLTDVNYSSMLRKLKSISSKTGADSRRIEGELERVIMDAEKLGVNLALKNVKDKKRTRI